MSYERSAYAESNHIEADCAQHGGGGFGDGYTDWGVIGNARGDSTYRSMPEMALQAEYEDELDAS